MKIVKPKLRDIQKIEWYLKSSNIFNYSLRRKRGESETEAMFKKIRT